MRKRTVALMTIIISVVLTALILVQVYWIHNALDAKDEQLRVLINSALDAVVAETEQQETLDRIVSEINIPSTDSILAIVPSQSPLAKQLEQIKPVSKIYDLPTSPGDLSITVNRGDQKIIFYSDDIFFPDESPEVSTESIKASIEDRLSNKTVMLENIMGRIMSDIPPLSERIDNSTLNQLMKNKFTRLGLDIGFEYRVTDGGREVHSSNDFSPRSSSRKYLRQLFPNDPIPGQYMLTVYFPKERKYLFSQIGFIGFSSIFITLLLIFFSSANLYIIMRQKKISEIRNDFINNMTHELKTPISTISLASQMMADRSISDDNKNLGKISKILDDESMRLKYHVERVLQASLFDKGTMDIKPVNTDIHELIRGVIDSYSLQVNERSGIISANFDSKVSNLNVDEVHFANMISNLIDNGIKYSVGSPEITVTTLDNQNNVIIRVTDKGIGIRREDLRRIFDKFYRVPTGNIHNVKGFGLGLSYVRKVAEEHGGSVKAYSNQESGTTFEIVLLKNRHNDTNTAGRR